MCLLKCLVKCVGHYTIMSYPKDGATFQGECIIYYKSSSKSINLSKTV